MRFELRQCASGRVPFGLIYGTIVLCALVFIRFVPVYGLLPRCVFKGLLGIPCPTCGTTRVLLYLANGDISLSLSMNPLVCMIILALLCFLLADAIQILFRTRMPRLSVDRTGGDMLRIAALLSIVANWAYLIVHQA